MGSGSVQDQEFPCHVVVVVVVVVVVMADFSSTNIQKHNVVDESYLENRLGFNSVAPLHGTLRRYFFQKSTKNKYQFVSDGMGVMGGSRQKHTSSGNHIFHQTIVLAKDFIFEKVFDELYWASCKLGGGYTPLDRSASTS
jgi:hypothetical protein